MIKIAVARSKKTESGNIVAVKYSLTAAGIEKYLVTVNNDIIKEFKVGNLGKAFTFYDNVNY